MIAVYVKPKTLSAEQYNKAPKGLDASGANMDERKHHFCFGEDGQLMVFEIWDSKVSYDAFGPFLMPFSKTSGKCLRRKTSWRS